MVLALLLLALAVPLSCMIVQAVESRL